MLLSYASISTPNLSIIFSIDYSVALDSLIVPIVFKAQAYVNNAINFSLLK